MVAGYGLLFKDKENSKHQKAKADQVIELYCLVFKKDKRENHEYHQRDHFLQYFQFNQRKGTPVFLKSYPIGGYLKEVFKEGNAPTDQNDADQPEIFKPLQVFELQMPVPGKGHKGIGKNQQDNRV